MIHSKTTVKKISKSSCVSHSCAHKFKFRAMLLGTVLLFPDEDNVVDEFLNCFLRPTGIDS